MKPAKNKYTLLQQVITTILGKLVSALSAKHGVDKQSRTFSAWSHVVAIGFRALGALFKP
jgi:hypothetical protein